MPAEQSREQIGAIILGAGFARRFGSDKRLATLNDIPVAVHTTRRYMESFDRVRVVLRHDDIALQNLLNSLDVEVVLTDQAHLGMGHSLCAGIDHVSWAWAFIALLDMPYVAPHTLYKLQDAARQCAEPAIVRPRFVDQPDAPAHPIGFHAAFFAQLQAARGDQGAREALRRHAAQIRYVDTDDAGVIADIDTPDDLHPLT